MQRIVWDFRYGATAPVNNRFTPQPDQLFGRADAGHLAAPGQYTVSMAKYEDGQLSDLAGPVSFTCTLLNQSSLPTNMEENVTFYKKADKLRKGVSAANDLLRQMEERIKNINLAILDMPAPAQTILEKTHQVQQQLIRMKTLLIGDETLAKREFETQPGINDRMMMITDDGVWYSTAPITTTFKDSYAVAAKQFGGLLSDLKKADTDLKSLESELEMNQAPYTPGRWPVWGDN